MNKIPLAHEYMLHATYTYKTYDASYISYLYAWHTFHTHKSHKLLVHMCIIPYIQIIYPFVPLSYLSIFFLLYCCQINYTFSVFDEFLISSKFEPQQTLNLEYNSSCLRSWKHEETWVINCWCYFCCCFFPPFAHIWDMKVQQRY